MDESRKPKIIEPTQRSVEKVNEVRGTESIEHRNQTTKTIGSAARRPSRNRRNHNARPHRRRKPRRAPDVQYRKPRARTEPCAYCGHRDSETVEHFIPQSSGLPIAFRRINLIPACRSCNEFKGGRWPNEKEIQWFFTYWQRQLQDVEGHLKIATAIQRTPQGNIPNHHKTSRRRRRR